MMVGKAEGISFFYKDFLEEKRLFQKEFSPEFTCTSHVVFKRMEALDM